jgi:hypothetical protein
MKKPSLRQDLQHTTASLTAIREACEVFRNSKTCPDHLKAWFEMIERQAEYGLKGAQSELH